ncbi:MAG: cell division protein ZapA [Deltaproteobacteria bacterium]|nr:cell division protein ZapA [Deltaproteobacteria bacterium]
MDQQPKPVVVEILGRPLQITGDIPPERLQMVARLVDERLRELQRAFPSSPLADLAILAALNMACEFLESKEDYQQLRTDIEQRSRQLIQKLEAHGSSSPPGP